MSVRKYELARWSRAHINDLCRNADNPKVAETLRNIFPNPYTIDDARIWIDICDHADESRVYNRAILVDGRAAGGIGIILQDDVYCKSAELGYWLGEDYWGRGIVSEAAAEICVYAFANFDIVRIFAAPFAGNLGSRRVLEKTGFEFEGTRKKSIYRNGRIEDSCMYALLRPES